MLQTTQLKKQIPIGEVLVSLVIRRLYDVTPDRQNILIPMSDETVKQVIAVAVPWRGGGRQR